MAEQLDNRVLLGPPKQNAKYTFWNSIRGDRGIWIIILLLSLISLAAVYSSCSSLAFYKGKTALFFLFKQLTFVLLGVTALYLCHRIPLGWYRKLAFLGIVAITILMVITAIAGTTYNDATRVLNIFGFSFQPSEVAKVALILYMAKVIEDRELKSFREFSIFLMIPVAILCLLLLWGSVSAGVIMGGTAFLIMLVSGISAKHLIKTAGIALMGIFMVITLAMTTPMFPRIETAVKRVTTFVDDGKGDSFQADQAKIAIASGGIVGKGPGNSTQRYILPKPYHDFIYAIIVEEYGIIGGTAVLFLFLWFFYRSYLIARQCTRTFSSLLVIGLGMLILFQAMVHMGVNVGILPVTGQTLPLVSLGGTSFVAMSAAFGIILSVSRTIEKGEVSRSEISLKGEASL
jgi:cell division protein FtsW